MRPANIFHRFHFYCLTKMASRFPTVSKDEILAVSEAAVPTNTKNGQNLGCRCLLVGRKKISH